MSMFHSDDIIPNIPTIQEHEFKCFRCGFYNRFIKPNSFVDWEKEYKVERKRRHDLIHNLNSLMQYAETHYSMNPNKDILIDALLKIRHQFED